MSELRNTFYETPAGEEYAARERALQAYMSGETLPTEPVHETVTTPARTDEPVIAARPEPVYVAAARPATPHVSCDNCIRFVHEDIPVQMAFTPEGASSKLVISMKAANVSDLDESVCLLVKSSDVSFTPPALCKFTIGVKGKEYRVMGVGVAHKIDNFTFIPLVKVIG